jgi:CRISPR-associated protein Csx3
VRLGWIASPTLTIAPIPTPSLPSARLFARPSHTRLEVALPQDYLDYGEAEGLTLPPLPGGKGVVLSGKLPHWLWTALAQAYHHAPWVAVFQPQLENQAVVIGSHDQALPVGSLVSSETP